MVDGDEAAVSAVALGEGWGDPEPIGEGEDSVGVGLATGAVEDLLAGWPVDTIVFVG